jgi:3-isopropylmalate/(R)-2-methylmalate dehydratase large subunit
VAFIGSCTNGRITDFEEVARLIQGRGFRVSPRVRRLIVPGSMEVTRGWSAAATTNSSAAAARDARGRVLECLARIRQTQGREIALRVPTETSRAAGSPAGRTLLMSPAMVAAAAFAGEVVDCREFFEIK